MGKVKGGGERKKKMEGGSDDSRLRWEDSDRKNEQVCIFYCFRICILKTLWCF